MADVKISALPSGTAANADLVPIVQGGTTKQGVASDVAKTLMDGTTQVAAIAVPSAPSAGNLKLFARNVAGRIVPDWMGPSGTDNGIQSALWGNAQSIWLPGTGTTAAISFGVSWTVAATQAHPAPASTNIMTQMRRATYSTTATSGNASGIRSAATVCWRGNAAGLGGFFFAARFGFLTVQSAMQFWVGLSGVTGLLAGEPSAQNDTICVGKDTGDTNMFIIERDGATATKTTTSVAPANNKVYDIFFFAAPNGSTVIGRMVDVGTGTVLIDNVTFNTHLPTNTVFLTAHAEVRAMTAGTVAICLSKIVVESDT